jgi:hypothetical protein
MAGWTFELMAQEWIRRLIHTPYQQLNPCQPANLRRLVNNLG